MKKKSKEKEHYRFWKWLILNIVNIPRLYVLAWGIILLLLTIFWQTDILRIIKDLP